MEWIYYTATAKDGTVMSIARRSGPAIQVLTSDGTWLNRPNLLRRFQDPDVCEPVGVDAARAAAAKLGIAWPS